MAFLSLGKLKGLMKGAKKFNNNDFLKAVCGLCVAVAYADGNCDEMEMATMETLIQNDESLSAFTPGDIETELERHKKNFSMNALVGKTVAKKDIQALAGEDQKEMAIVLAIAVAGADGEIDDKHEIPLIKEFAKILGVSTSQFGI